MEHGAIEHHGGLVKDATKGETVIKLQVTSVARKSASHLSTITFTYEKDQPRKMTRNNGAEWEEIEFRIVDEDEPSVQVANITGDVFIVSEVIRMVLQNPKLFGTFKMGDIVPLAPLLTEKTVPSGDHQSSPSRTESDKGA